MKYSQFLTKISEEKLNTDIKYSQFQAIKVVFQYMYDLVHFVFTMI